MIFWKEHIRVVSSTLFCVPKYDILLTIISIRHFICAFVLSYQILLSVYLKMIENSALNKVKYDVVMLSIPHLNVINL